MANASAHKTLKGFNNEEQEAWLEYDFANDGGAAGTYSLATLGDKVVFTEALVFVETACTSGGAATVSIGTSSSDPDAFLDVTSGAVANLVDNALLQETTKQHYAASAETVDLVIGTAALTAGKIRVFVKYVRVD